MSLSLDGHTSFIGTEFIKLLNTGSSDLATVQYVDDKVAEGGGGGVQPEDVYTKTETDNLLNAKLNVSNPQDILGNLRLDPTNGLSKIILNAVGVPNDEDFYVNGSAYINSEMRASSIKCDNDKGNFISNNDANTDLKLQINSNDFITLSTANDVIEVDKDIEMHSSVLKSDVLDTWSNASLQIRRNGTNYISLDGDDTISISRQSKISSNKADGVDMTVSHHNNTTNLFEKKLSFKNGNEIFATGDGGADEELLLNYYTDAGVRIGNATDGYLTIKGARNATHTLTVNGSTYFGGAVSYNGDIVLTNPYQLKTNNISTNGLNDLVFNIDTLGEFFRCQASDFTVRLPNNRTFLAQNIVVDNLQPLAFANDVVLNGGNSTNDAYEEYIRLDASTERVNVSKIIDTNEHIYMNLNKRLYLNDTVGSERYIVSTFRSGTPSFNQLDIVNENSSNGRIRLMIDTEENVIIENSQLYSKRVITAVAGVKGNTYNSNGDNNVVFQRNNSTYMTFNTNRVEINQELRLSNALIIDTAEKLTIRPSLEPSAGGDLNIFDIINAHPVANNPMIRFRCGDGAGESIICDMRNTGVTMSRDLIVASAYGLKTNTINSNGNNTLNIQQNGDTFISLLGDTLNRVQINRFLRVVDSGNSTQAQFVNNGNGNYTEFRLGNHINAYLSGASNGNTLHLNYYSHGNVMLGTTLDTTPDPIPTISINKFSSGAGNAFEVQGNSVFSGTVSTNTLNSEGDNDLVFERNGTEYIKLERDSTPTDLIRMAHSVVIDNNRYLFTNNIRHDTGTQLNLWSTSSIRLLSNANNILEVKPTQIDFNANVVSAYSITAFDLIETSDKRLKDNIENVDEDCSEIVKKVEVKTYNMKNDDKKKSHIGFVAQEVATILPRKFEAVVNDDGERMGINYGKMSAILWKALQEEMAKTEYLESKLFETIARVEALEKPKKRTTTKTTT